MQQDRFDETLEQIIGETSARALLRIPGVYEIVAEEFNNEVLSRDGVEPLTVYFRRLSGVTLAVFPEMRLGHSQEYVKVYGQLGHGYLPFKEIMEHSTTATEAEYIPIQQSLEQIGYTLDIQETTTPQRKDTMS